MKTGGPASRDVCADQYRPRAWNPRQTALVAVKACGWNVFQAESSRRAKTWPHGPQGRLKIADPDHGKSRNSLGRSRRLAQGVHSRENDGPSSDR